MELSRVEPWMEDAVCRGSDPNVFFPEGEYEKNSDEYKEHKRRVLAMCAVCPVRQACRDYADHHRIKDGIWGGEAGPTRGRRWLRETRERRAQQQAEEVAA